MFLLSAFFFFISRPSQAIAAHVFTQYFFPYLFLIYFLFIGWFMPSEWRVRWSTLEIMVIGELGMHGHPAGGCRAVLIMSDSN